MSENFAFNPSLHPTPTQRGETTYTSLVEDHASQLMDELFQDLDTAEDSVPKAPISPSPQTISSAASQLALAVKSDELQDSLLVPYVEMDAILEPFYGIESDPIPLETSTGKSSSSLLLGLAWGTFLGTASLLALTQFNTFTRQTAGVPATQAALVASQPQDAAFATELGQLLQSPNPASSPEPVTTTALPTIAQTAPTISPTISSVGSAQIALPPVTTPPTKATVVATKAPQSTTLKPKPPQTIALANLSNRLPVLNGGQSLPNSFTPPNLPPSLAPQSLPMGHQAKAGVTVQGILDLGPKSAMLISRNGSTQNVRLGEVLDATGWVFLRVENGQAILQRGNETRSVSGGEQF